LHERGFPERVFYTIVITMNIHLATDHAGFIHKEAVKKYLTDHGMHVIDHGAIALQTDDDYPDYVVPCAKAVALDPGSMGIVFGYSGEGEAMAANRVTDIRAVVYYGGTVKILTLSREHNNANMLSLGAHFITQDEAIHAVALWLNTPFSGEERHTRRLAKF
jgi:ribose 5-phosphate isomerase B